MSVVQLGPNVLAAAAILAGAWCTHKSQPPAGRHARDAAPGHRHQRQPPSGRHAGERRADARAAGERRSVAPGRRTRGRRLRIEAFGEGSAPLSAPAPLIRVPEGTEIAASIRNELASPMRVNGLCERGGGCVRADRRSRLARAGRCDSRPAPPGPITTGRRQPACRFRFARWATRSSRVRSSSTRRGRPGHRAHLRHHRLDQPDARRS